MKLILAFALIFFLFGCSSISQEAKPKKFQYISYENIHPSIKKRVPKGQSVKACGPVIKFSAPENIEDGSDDYYSNATGKLIFMCGYWQFLKYQEKAEKMCPPPGWKKCTE